MAIAISDCVIQPYWRGIVLFLSIIALFLITGSDAANVSREEFSKSRKLQSLDETAVKSIKTDDGDIFDCVDIYKQPAFDHPLLKDHKIQMWPTSVPEGLEIRRNSTSEMTAEVGLPNGGCPQGRVPIRRIQMRDLLRIKSLSKSKKTPIKSVATFHHWVSIQTQDGGEYYGARAEMNVWNPSVGKDEFSLGQFWITSGNPGDLNTVEAGWTVNPTLYGDYRPRLFVFWTADDYGETGCYNTLCPGFVQVSRDVAPGSPVQPVSTYNGGQQYITLQAFKDVRTKNWWVAFGDLHKEKLLGYFPSSLFNTLADRASSVRWGGEVFTGKEVGQPQMGSGHFPSEGFRKAAFMRMVMTVDEKNTLTDAPTNTYAVVDEPNCYNVDDPNQFGDNTWRRFFYFGGPGC